MSPNQTCDRYCTDMYKTERLELRLTPRELKILDQVRGGSTRSAWLRNQIIKAQPNPHLAYTSTDDHQRGLGT